MTFCHVCWKNKGYELGSFSRLRMPDAFSFFCMSTEFQPHVFETNRKQTTCTNQFSMCLSRRQFQCRNSSRKFFCSGMSEDIHQEMRALPRIFHLKAQHEALTLLFPSVRWSKSWNLRETDYVFEWKIFFSCVVGFFALAADPRVFRVASRR